LQLNADPAGTGTQISGRHRLALWRPSTEHEAAARKRRDGLGDGS
jgi:hypothetical protein